MSSQDKTYYVQLAESVGILPIQQIFYCWIIISYTVASYDFFYSCDFTVYNLSLTPCVVCSVSKNINIWKSLDSTHSTLQVNSWLKECDSRPWGTNKRTCIHECGVLSWFHINFLTNPNFSISGRSLCHSFTGSRCFFCAFRTSSYAQFSQCLCAGRAKKWFERFSLQPCYFFQSQIILCALRQVFAEMSMCLYLSIYLLNHRTIESFRLEKTFKIKISL